MEATYGSNDDLLAFALQMEDHADKAENEDYDEVLTRLRENDGSTDLNTSDLLTLLNPERVRLLSDLLKQMSRVSPGQNPAADQWCDMVDAADKVALKDQL